MAETMSPTHINPLAAPKRQSLGIAVHETDAQVIDADTLEELRDGGVGEIIVQGPQVLQATGTGLMPMSALSSSATASALSARR